MIADPLRIQFILRDGLSSIQVVPLLSRSDPVADSVCGGMLVEAAELLTFIQDIGLDSVVRTRALSENPLRLLREFLVDSPQSIVRTLEARMRAESEAVDRLLEGESLTEKDNLALNPLEHFVLGGTSVACAEGVRRTTEWFAKRDGRKRQ